MTPKEFYESLQEKKPFTKLTNTGISDNLPNVFEFAKMYAEAISVTRCCETLKDKEKLSFKDWKFSKGLRYVCGHTFKDNDGDIYDGDEIEKMYANYLNL